MAAIPGTQFNLTGSSGTAAALVAKSSWRCYIVPRGAFASQDSTGTLITFDSAGVAGRFAANDWIQVGLSTDNLRRVSAVGGNSLNVAGSAVTVSENNRIFIIGNTQPTVTGGSATYTIPRTTIRQRGDDGADLYTNSMVTSDSDGLIRFYSDPAVYDAIIQDGNQGNQGYIADLAVGVAEGISTSYASVFGATVTVNAAFGITGVATFGQSAVFNGAVGFTGWATFGTTVTMNSTLGVTNHATFGATLTVHGAIGITGQATFGATVTVNAGVTVSGQLAGVSATFSQDVTLRRLVPTRGTTFATTDFTFSSGWGDTASIMSVSNRATDTRGFVNVRAGGTGITDNPTVHVNFKDGTFPNSGLAYSYCNRNDTNAPTTAWWLPMAVGSTQAGFRFIGLPVSGTQYGLAWLVIG